MPSLRNVSVAPWLVRLSQEAGVMGGKGQPDRRSGNHQK